MIISKLIVIIKMTIMTIFKVIIMRKFIMVIKMSRLIMVVSKVIMMSKGSIGNFLADEQPLPLGQEIIRFCSWREAGINR